MAIELDEFWDGQTGGGVRCSSTGDAASKYQDPGTHTFEGNGGRSVASLLPTSRGLRGVIIPRATAYGGSKGFDAHKPRLVNIDPDIKGQSCVVDLSQLTKEAVEKAYLEAADNPIAQADIRLLAAQTFHNLAVGYEPVGMGPSRSVRQNVERRHPLGQFAGYVVPKAALGGGQQHEGSTNMPINQSNELLSPSVAPRGRTISPAQAVQQIADRRSISLTNDDAVMMDEGTLPPTDFQPLPPQQQQVMRYPRPTGLSDQTQPGMVKAAKPLVAQTKPQNTTAIAINSIHPGSRAPIPSVPVPNTKVVFEMEGWGQFEAVYHEVIRNDCLLVLVWNDKFKGGMKFMPPASDKTMAVRVDGSPKVFFVQSFGSKFKHGDNEYCMLIIDQEQEVSDGETGNSDGGVDASREW